MYPILLKLGKLSLHTYGFFVAMGYLAGILIAKREAERLGEDPDKRDYIVSNEKIEKTGFMPKHSLEIGIKELIKVYTIISNSKYGNV